MSTTDFSDQVDPMAEQYKRRENPKVEVVDFRPEHAAAFRRTTLDWITRYWEVEDADRLYLDLTAYSVAKNCCPGGICDVTTTSITPPPGHAMLTELVAVFASTAAGIVPITEKSKTPPAPSKSNRPNDSKRTSAPA